MAIKKSHSNNIESVNRQLNQPNELESSVQHVTDMIGEFGRWQMWLLVYIFLIDIVSAFNNMGFTFHAYKTDFWCADVPQDYHNKTEDMKCFKFTNHSEKCTSWRYDKSMFEKTIITEVSIKLNKININY